MHICTLDLTNLYTSIPHAEGIQGISEMLTIHRQPHALPNSNDNIELWKVVLTNNYFNLNREQYLQISGTAMGTKLAHSNAHILWLGLRKNIYIHITPPTLRKMFIDDIFHIWQHDLTPLKKFIDHLNTVHPTIRFTNEILPNETPFLDLIINM